MVSAKAALVEARLENARLHANWKEVPECARKYRRHHPEGTVLEKTVLAEHALIEVLEAHQRPPDYGTDSPEQLAVPPPVQPELLKGSSELIEGVLPDASGPVKDQAIIILARIQFSSGNYSGCLTTLAPIPLPPPSLPSGYSLVLVIQGLALKGMALEKVGDTKDGLACYDAAVKIVEQATDRTSEAFMWWSEEALYRIPFLRIRLGTPMQAFTAFRNYFALSNFWPPLFRIHKRASFLRMYIRFIAFSYVSGSYIPPPLSDINVSDGAASPQTFKQEIASLCSTYEQAVYATTVFPRAEEKNHKVLEMADMVVGSFDLAGGGTASELQQVVDILYRATHHTFNSPRILRHLSHLLVTLGEFREAEMALQSYVSFIDRGEPPTSSPAITPVEIKPASDDFPSLNLPHKYSSADVPRGSEQADAGGLLPEGRLPEPMDEGDDDDVDYSCFWTSKLSPSINYFIDEERPVDIVKTLLMGARFAARDIRKPDACIRYAKHALKVCEDSLRKAELRRLSKAYMLLGIGYGMLVDETLDKDLRPKYQNTAIDALKKAVDLHQANWEATYALAVQYATVGNVDQALSTAEKALSLNARYTNTYHLLVILLTAKRRLDGALLVCDAGLMDSDGSEASAAYCLTSLSQTPSVASGVTSGVPTTSTLDSHSNGAALHPSASVDRAAQRGPGPGMHIHPRPLKAETAIAEEAEAYFALQMTKVAIIQAKNGNLSDITLKSQERLHALHGKVYGSLSTIWESLGAPVAQALQARLSVMPGSRSLPERSSSSSVRSGAKQPARASSSSSKLQLQDYVVRNPVLPSAGNLAPSGGGAGGSGGAGTAAKGDGSGSIRKSGSGILRPKAYAPSVASASGGSVRTQQAAAGTYQILKSPSLSQLAATAANPPSAYSTGGILSFLLPDRRSIHPETRRSKRSMRGFMALADLWIFSAGGLREAGLYDKAAEMLDVAEAVGVNESDVYCERAFLKMEQGQYEEAFACLLRALSNDTHHVRSEVALGKLHLATGRLDLAEGVLTAATEGLGWASPEAWLALGQVYSAMGRYRRARECLLFAASWDSVTGLRGVDVLPRCP